MNDRIPLEIGTALLPYWAAVKRALVPLAIILTPTAIIGLSLAHVTPTPAKSLVAEPDLAKFAAPRKELATGTGSALAVNPATAPASPGPAAQKLVAAVPYMFRGSASAREYAVSCLAAAAWYEAGSDAESQKSVIQVVINRLRHPAFPKTVCGVVFQGSSRSTGCQFTFTCDGSLDRRSPSPKAWEAARLRAQAALDGAVDAEVAQATHYHADYVSPWWSDKLVRLATVGRQIFYRWPGARERLTARPPGGDDSDRQFMAMIDGTAKARAPADAAQIVPAPVIDREIAEIPSLQMATLSAAARSVPGNSFIQTLDGTNLAGRWAVGALGKCGKKRGCSVFGYLSGDQASRNSQVPPGQRDRPAFLYVNDAATGATLVLWDCERVQRPDPAQCLPPGPTAFRQLTRNIPE